MDPDTKQLPVIADLPIPLDRDVFLRSLLRELAGTLQDVVGLDEASGFISVVGQKIGCSINERYKTALSTDTVGKEQLGEVLVDLKRRIQGDLVTTHRQLEWTRFGDFCRSVLVRSLADGRMFAECL